MAIVWILEKQKEPQNSLSLPLLGDFAVRRFASPDSIMLLAKIRQSSKPDVFVVDSDEFSRNDVSSLRFSVGNCPVVYVGYQKVSRLCGDEFYFLRSNDSFELSKQIRSTIEPPKSAGIQQYKDLTLDFMSLSFHISACEVAEPLSPKEVLLLKWFLDHVGELISREQLKDVVWKGIAVGPRTIDSHVSRLRKKLSVSEVSIESVYGKGYIMN